MSAEEPALSLSAPRRPEEAAVLALLDSRLKRTLEDKLRESVDRLGGRNRGRKRASARRRNITAPRKSRAKATLRREGARR